MNTGDLQRLYWWESLKKLILPPILSLQKIEVGLVNGWSDEGLEDNWKTSEKSEVLQKKMSN